MKKITKLLSLDLSKCSGTVCPIVSSKAYLEDFRQYHFFKNMCCESLIFTIIYKLILLLDVTESNEALQRTEYQYLKTFSSWYEWMCLTCYNIYTTKANLLHLFFFVLKM